MSRPVSGAGNVIKEGAGAVVVSGNFTHTGTTTIAAGTLSLVGSISGSTVIEVQADATFDVVSTPGGFTLQAAETLSGKGTVAGDTAINGTVSPGPGIATLTTESLTFNGGSTFALEINTATRAEDRILSSGDFSRATGVLPTLSVTDVGGNVPLALGTQLTLLTYTGDWNGGLFRVAGAPIADGGVFTLGANQFQLDYDAGGNSLALITVPEPGAAILLLTGFTSLVGFGRRRK
jgi:autotransporter-associated beta strand protein